MLAHTVRSALARVTDAVAEATVAPSFSRIGIGLRSRLEEWSDPALMKGRVVLVTGATAGIGPRQPPSGRPLGPGPAGRGPLLVRRNLGLGAPFGAGPPLWRELETRRFDQLTEGATPDWWTVVRADPDHLVLASFGWFCGDSWLGCRVNDAPPQLEQVAAFRPKGLLGLAYWLTYCLALWPVPRVVFRIMMQGRVSPVNWVHRARFARRAGPGAAAGGRTDPACSTPVL